MCLVIAHRHSHTDAIQIQTNTTAAATAAVTSAHFAQIPRAHISTDISTDVANTIRDRQSNRPANQDTEGLFASASVKLKPDPRVLVPTVTCAMESLLRGVFSDHSVRNSITDARKSVLADGRIPLAIELNSNNVHTHAPKCSVLNANAQQHDANINQKTTKDNVVACIDVESPKYARYSDLAIDVSSMIDTAMDMSTHTGATSADSGECAYSPGAMQTCAVAASRDTCAQTSLAHALENTLFNLFDEVLRGEFDLRARPTRAVMKQ